MRLIVRASFIIFIISFLGACNLFFSSPHGRENLDDEAAQITAFTAVPSSDNSVVTMWNWKEPPSWVYDDRITEIQIQHSIFGYPENYIFFAGESVTDKTEWQKEWKDLIPGITHYFSLFAKSTNNDGKDILYAPIKAKVSLKDIKAVSDYSVDLVGSFSQSGSPSYTFSQDPGSLDVNLNKYSLISLDINDVYITKALLIVDVTFINLAGNVDIVALAGDIPNIDSDRWNFVQNNTIIDLDTKVTKNFTASGINTINVTEIVKSAAFFQNGALVLRVPTGSNADIMIDNVTNKPYLLVDFIN